jgi:hypothetical protein
MSRADGATGKQACGAPFKSAKIALVLLTLLDFMPPDRNDAGPANMKLP